MATGPLLPTPESHFRPMMIAPILVLNSGNRKRGSANIALSQLILTPDYEVHSLISLDFCEEYRLDALLDHSYPF